MIDEPRLRERRSGCSIRAALEAGDTAQFAALMHEHWDAQASAQRRDDQRRRSTSWYEVGRRATARVGGKLVGAGAGGFLMFYAEDPRRAARRDGRRAACPRSGSASTTTAAVVLVAELTDAAVRGPRWRARHPHAPARPRRCRSRCSAWPGDRSPCTSCAGWRARASPTSSTAIGYLGEHDPRRASATARARAARCRYVDEGEDAARHRRARCGSRVDEGALDDRLRCSTATRTCRSTSPRCAPSSSEPAPRR